MDAIFTNYVLAPIAFWPLYGLPAAAGALPALLSLVGRPSKSTSLDWSVLFAPYALWLVLATVVHPTKTYFNLIELPAIGVGVAMLSGIRWVVARHSRDRIAGVRYLGIACIVSAAIALSVPRM